MRVKRVIYLIALMVLFAPGNSYAQNSGKISRSIPFYGDTLVLENQSIIASSFSASSSTVDFGKSDYFFDPIKSRFFLKLKNTDTIHIDFEYELLQINLNQTFAHKSDSIIFKYTDTNSYENFLFKASPSFETVDFFSDSQLEKQGSISRGVTIGNAQNLSFQSTLNLQLNGKIGPYLYIKGSISDNNIPFQPEGNTQKLQEFDQVFLQLYNDNFAVTGGDFWLNKPKGYFLNYQKRTQGLSIDYRHELAATKHKTKAKHKISGAFSKGKFARNIIQGIEGNQGPYRLVGAENEQNIIILAGTEKIYIDGQLLKRGQEYDYIINYNSGELTFTANQLITKDKRIIVEFQYSDLNYARSLFAYNASVESDNYRLWFNYYSEQDAKNQPIQQDLNAEQKQVLSFIGDSISNAFLSSINQVDFNEDRIMYYLKDSLGYDSVLVFTNHPDSAMYQATFRFVGEEKGNYSIDKYTANGKVFKWEEPISGTPQGSYEPVLLVIPPQKKQMVTVGTEYQIGKTVSTAVELAMSNTDLNTFSNLHQSDNRGYGLKWDLSQKKDFKSKDITLGSNASFELNDRNFVPIQWFRSAEFDRDWNVRNKNYSGNQYISSANLFLAKKELGSIRLGLNQLTWGNDYSGLKNDVAFRFNTKGITMRFDGNYLFSSGLENTKYFKHQAWISKKWKTFNVGVKDIFERNQIFNQDALQSSSFQFYDVKAFISTGDSTSNFHEFYYQKRYDWHPDSTHLTTSAEADNIGLTSHFLKNKSNQLKLNINYRQLHIIEKDLINQAPENTILGRLGHQLFLWKGGLTTKTFYEINSGLELKRDFIYLQVNTGQGVYTWIDYNGDGIKDLGEFEVAQFQDQAEYIRVSIVSNDYVRTYGNQLAQTIFLKPERLIKKTTGIHNVIRLFSNQTVFRTNRKTNYEDGFSAFNPFRLDIADSSLIQTNSNFRNTVFFNRLNPKFGLEYNIQINSSKFVLTNGTDFKSQDLQKIKLRWNIAKKYNLSTEYNTGNKEASSEYASNRNYDFTINALKTAVSYQPNTKFRIALINEYSIKDNRSDINEKAVINDIGTEIRYNQAKKGSLTSNFKYILIEYNALASTPIAFEMLNAFKPGVNFSWGLTYQRKIANNLQLNFNYNGRKSESSQFIHSGGMELRAFF